MSKTLAGALLTLLAAKPLAAQFPRLAPPPPCKTTYSSPTLLSYWTGASRDNRPKVAVFALQPDVDDAGRVYLSVAIPDRIRQRLALDPKIRVASEGTVSRALMDARSRPDSAATLLDADYLVTGRILIFDNRQEVEVVLHRRGQPAPAWQASFRATTSLKSVEESIVRGLSRALGLNGPPAVPRGWPKSDAAHDAILAGDAYLRSPSRSSADSSVFYYDKALTLEPGSALAALLLARASVMLLERGGEIPSYPGGPDLGSSTSLFRAPCRPIRRPRGGRSEPCWRG